MTADFNFYINRQGARGKQGEKGDQGFSPIVTVATDTPTEYTLNVVTEDSSFTTPNLKANAINIIPGAGKYVLFDESTNTMYNSAKPSELVDTTMFATTSNAGIIMIADNDDITQSSTDVAVTPKQLNDAIDEVESVIPTDTVTHTELNTAINGVTAQIPGIATSTNAGIIKPDGVTTTVAADGTLTAIQSTPANMVTLDTEQTISANKSTTGTIHLRPNTIGAGDKTLYLTQGNVTFGSGLASTAYNITTDNGDLKFAVTSYGTQSSGFTFTNNFTTIRLANTITIGGNTVLTNASVDGTTITYDSATGKISAAVSAPSNMVTTDTTQTITGAKTFVVAPNLNAGVNSLGNIKLLNDYTQGISSAIDIQPYYSEYNFDTTVPIRFRTTLGDVSEDVINLTGHWVDSSTLETTVNVVADNFNKNGNNVLDSSNVDGTTIVYDSITKKISSISSAPTVIDGGEEV